MIKEKINEYCTLYLQVESLRLKFGESYINKDLEDHASITSEFLNKEILINGKIKRTFPEIVSLKYETRPELDDRKHGIKKEIKKENSITSINFSMTIFRNIKKIDNNKIGEIEFFDTFGESGSYIDRFFGIHCFYEESIFDELYKKLSNEPKSIQDIKIDCRFYLDKRKPTTGSYEVEIDFIQSPKLDITSLNFLYAYDYKK